MATCQHFRKVLFAILANASNRFFCLVLRSSCSLSTMFHCDALCIHIGSALGLQSVEDYSMCCSLSVFPSMFAALELQSEFLFDSAVELQPVVDYSV